MNYLWSFLFGAFVGAAALAAWQAPTTVTEAPATAVPQDDGSLVLERTATNPKAKSPSKIPKGGKVERVIHGEIQPNAPGCPRCTFDLTLVQMPDDSRRVVLWSATGAVLGGLDVPVLPLAVEKEHVWALGVSRALAADTWGLWLDRDFAFVRTGLEINKIEADPLNGDRTEARLKLGFRF